MGSRRDRSDYATRDRRGDHWVFVLGLFVPGDLISGINITPIIVATLGAILLLAIYRWFAGRRAARV